MSSPMKSGQRAAVAGAACLAVCSCTVPPQSTDGLEESASDYSHRRPIYITDRHGVRFDVTHAVHRYGMRAAGFQFGIGKNTIRPIDHPNMLSPGDPGYPSEGSRWSSGPDIIGISVDDDIRSYPVQELARHEIVNETIGHTQAAVAY